MKQNTLNVGAMGMATSAGTLQKIKTLEQEYNSENISAIEAVQTTYSLWDESADLSLKSKNRAALRCRLRKFLKIVIEQNKFDQYFIGAVEDEIKLMDPKLLDIEVDFSVDTED